MEKIKEFLNGTAGKVVLVVAGFGLGWYLAKRKKRTGYARR